MFLDASHTPPVPFDDTLGGWSIAAGLRNDCVALVQEIIMVLQKFRHWSSAVPHRGSDGPVRDCARPVGPDGCD
jgi:hypothetical protein